MNNPIVKTLLNAWWTDTGCDCRCRSVAVADTPM